MKNKFVISIDSIMYFFVFFLNFISFQNVDIYNYIKYFIILICFIYCILNIKILFSCSKTKKINILLFLLLIWCVFSSFYKTPLSTRNSILASIVNYISLIESVFIIELAFIKGKEKKLLKRFWSFFLIFISIQFLEILFALVTNDLYDLRLYLFGNKFSVSSLFLKSIIFRLLYDNYENNYSRRHFIILTVLLIFVSKSISCTT